MTEHAPTYDQVLGVWIERQSAYVAAIADAILVPSVENVERLKAAASAAIVARARVDRTLIQLCGGAVEQDNDRAEHDAGTL